MPPLEKPDPDTSFNFVESGLVTLITYMDEKKLFFSEAHFEPSTHMNLSGLNFF